MILDGVRNGREHMRVSCVRTETCVLGFSMVGSGIMEHGCKKKYIYNK